jgi:hypothetical protein
MPALNDFQVSLFSRQPGLSSMRVQITEELCAGFADARCPNTTASKALRFGHITTAAEPLDEGQAHEASRSNALSPFPLSPGIQTLSSVVARVLPWAVRSSE